VCALFLLINCSMATVWPLRE